MTISILEMLLLPLATWRAYRFVASDTGPKCLLRHMRIKLGVKYAIDPATKNPDYKRWTTKDGSFAELVTCSKCATIWLGIILVLLAIFTPDIVYLLVALPLNASALALTYENMFYAPHEKD